MMSNQDKNIKQNKNNNHQKCNEMLLKAVTNNTKIQKLIDNIETLGCKIPKDFFVCRPCDANITGGFTVSDNSNKSNNETYRPQIILCEDNMIEKETFEHTIIHELVHAYDVCRAKIDFKDCKQHACTEIRASALSGECNILHELYRGKYKQLSGGHKLCVERRATKSLEMNPNCKANANEIVKQVMDKCYNDTKPFDD